jgi:Ser/Thr protein kinase RdoA (MazF antagonist)
MKNPIEIIANFDVGDDVSAIGCEPLGDGHINNTWKIQLNNGSNLVIQKLNDNVFPDTHVVADNVAVVSRYLSAQMRMHRRGQRTETIRLIPTQTGQSCHVDEEGGCWRVMEFWENIKAPATAENTEHVAEAGRALGTFHKLTADLNVGALKFSLPDFHITPYYLRHYDQVIHRQDPPAVPNHRKDYYDYCTRFIDEHRHLTNILAYALTNDELELRPTHNDPKLDNIAIDIATNKAVGMLDLDTVQPGLILHDIADLARSSCNVRGENTQDFGAVSFDIELFSALLEGYVESAPTVLSEYDFKYMYDALKILPFELGLRYFDDYNDKERDYFKQDPENPESKLERAITQFSLCESIEQQEHEIKSIISRCQH